MKKVVVFCNSLVGLMSFRKELLESLVKDKYQVFVVAPTEQEYLNDLKKLKCVFIPIGIDSRGTNPIKDFKIIRDFKKNSKKNTSRCGVNLYD